MFAYLEKQTSLGMISLLVTSYFLTYIASMITFIYLFEKYVR